MADSISTDPLGNDPINSNESDFVAQLGRISGKLLSANLLRNGAPLAFETDLLYLDTASSKIGIRTDTPINELTINGDLRSKTAIFSNNSQIANILIQTDSLFTTTVGPIEIFPTGNDPTAVFDIFSTNDIFFDANRISSYNSSDIVFNPAGTGSINLNADTNINGNLYSTQTITINGNLDFGGNLIVGDEITDTLNIVPNFQNDIVPNLDNVFELGSSSLKWRNVYANDAVLDAPVTVSDFVITSPANILLQSGPVNFSVNGIFPLVIFDKLSTDVMSFQGNKIQTTVSNLGILIDANGTGIVDLSVDANIDGNLQVSGSITLDGNLSTNSNIIIGNEIADLLFIDTAFQQDLNPGDDITYDLGSVTRRWRTAYIDDTSRIENFNVGTYIIGDQLQVGVGGNNIQAINSNEDVVFFPGSGRTQIENIRFEQDDITNLNNNALRLASTGIGYYRFEGTNALLFPAGTDAERPSNPEVGDTRWNTTRGVLECFDGTIYIRAIGPGAIVTVSQVEDFGNLFSLVLG